MPTLDPILFWNEVALEANRVSHTNGAKEQIGPPLSARALAIVHLAMYDAFAAIANDAVNLPPYLLGLPAPPAGSDLAAAVAGAAHKTLSTLFPTQQAVFDQRLLEAGNPANPGHGFGVQVAQALLTDRQNDPNADSTGYKPSKARGKHRADPDNPDLKHHAAFYGAQSKGFAITERHGLAAPPFDNDEYRKALREVRGKGIAPELMGTLPGSLDARSPEETVIGLFWGYDGAAGLGTPPRLYNQIVRQLAIHKNNTPAENARLFALVNTAMADAGILAWDQKYIYEFWRPVLGVREHDASFGPGAMVGANKLSKDADPGWLPLGAPATNSSEKNFTPPFPAYPSGHATFGAAALHMARLFYGVKDRKADKLFDGLSFMSEELNGMNRDNHGTVRPNHLRSFPGGLWQMIEENGRSRVFLGVHWVFDAFAVKDDKPDLSKNIGGVALGLTIAEDIFNGGRAKGLKKSLVGPRT